MRPKYRTRAEHDDARRRSLNGHKAKAAGNIVIVSGQPVSMADMAARLGVSQSTASKRLRAAQQLPGPVTWEALGA